jgi:uncharacterized protein (DUF305 family)
MKAGSPVLASRFTDAPRRHPYLTQSGFAAVGTQPESAVKSHLRRCDAGALQCSPVGVGVAKHAEPWPCAVPAATIAEQEWLHYAMDLVSGAWASRDTVMKMSIAFLVSAFLMGFPGISWAIEYENDDDDRSGHVPVVAHETFVLAPGESVDPAIIRTDLDYTTSMKHHHEGAVTMSTDYLGDPRGTNPILRKMARAIITNQRFEIAVLDVIRRYVEQGPETVADLGTVRVMRRKIGVDGLEHQWKFVKRRPPGFLDLALAPGLEASERDVKFSKEMMLHHQMALDMARAYNADPKATNFILKRLNLDIIVDQANEIGFLQRIVDRFPGDPDAVPGMDMPTDHSGGPPWKAWIMGRGTDWSSGGPRASVSSC